MTVLHQEIRTAIQQRAATATGFPPPEQRAYESLTFNPTRDVPWARFTFKPNGSRPIALTGGTKHHKGMMQISLFYPSANGTAAADEAASNLCAAFDLQELPLPTDKVTIDYAERGQTLIEPDWLHVPVTIGWRCYSTRN